MNDPGTIDGVENIESIIEKIVEKIVSEDPDLKKEAAAEFIGLKLPIQDIEKAVEQIKRLEKHRHYLVRYCAKQFLKNFDNNVKITENKDKNSNGASAAAKKNNVLSIISAYYEKARNNIEILSVVIVLIIILQVAFYAYFSINTVDSSQNADGGINEKIKTAAGSEKQTKAENNVLNKIVFKQDKAYISVRGKIENVDLIKRQIIINLNEHHDKCIINMGHFADSVSSYTKGMNIAVDGEVIQNDNMGPIIIKPANIQPL